MNSNKRAENKKSNQPMSIDEIVSKLAYPDERKLIAKSGPLVP